MVKVIEVTTENIEELGFTIETSERDEKTYVRLIAPLTIDSQWNHFWLFTHVGPQAENQNIDTSNEVSINFHYSSQVEYVPISIGYHCDLVHHKCDGPNGHSFDVREYRIKLDRHFITSGSRHGTAQSAAP